MSKKDFELIARVIHELTFHDDFNKKYIAEQFVVELEKTNVNFNRRMFMSAAVKGSVSRPRQRKS